MKQIGCTVEHKYTGIFAICDEDMVNDLDWIFVSKFLIKF